jgi:4-alpha-glucanotransferase
MGQFVGGGRVNGSREPEPWGVERGYWDVAGRWREVPEATVRAVMEAISADASGPPVSAPLVTAPQFGPWPELPPGTLVLEDGASIRLARGEAPPPDLPLGYHRLEPAEDGDSVTVAVCPDQCPSPLERAWGWSAQLYATRSSASWGMGDFGDLRRLAGWAVKNGAGFVLTNPLHAPAPGAVPEPSPYFPSSRCFLNPLYIQVEDVPGATELAEVADLAEKARALNGERLIDRSSVWALKSRALEALFARSERAGGGGRFGTGRFEAFVKQRGALLEAFTSFCALAERYGCAWPTWPTEYRRADSPAVARFVASRKGRSRKRYFAWLQWLCEEQLRKAVDRVCLVNDLAVGVDGKGADAWLWQDAYALAMRVGAPPDNFNVKGQDWGLAPWDPWKLRASSYQPYIETLRAVLRQAGGLRVDHVMGLFRLFWVPAGSDPTEGAYVRYPWQDMLALLRLEARRAGAYVVGEDLGTVEDYVREALHQSGVLSSKIFWFEPVPPRDWSHQSLGSVTTHDLPTVAGVWSGYDVAAQHAAGVVVNQEGNASFRHRIQEWARSDNGMPLAEVIEATYSSLGTSHCMLLSAALDDALAVEERPNMPGTIDSWPNWSLALPASLEEIEHSPLAAGIAEALGARTRHFPD